MVLQWGRGGKHNGSHVRCLGEESASEKKGGRIKKH